MTKIFFSLFLIAIINRACVTAKNKWCDVDCHLSPGPHVLCNYSPNTVSKSCGTVIQAGLSLQDKKSILNKHNSLRQKVARGQESRGNPGPQPASTNMPNMVWDDTLASIAQAWANQCNYGHRCSHLSSSYSDQIGQNIAQAWGEDVPYDTRVQQWYNEVVNFNRNHVKSYVFITGPKQIGHYSQIVWGKTTKVGCGGMKYKTNGMMYVYLVCNYGPAGNLPGAEVYETS